MAESGPAAEAKRTAGGHGTDNRKSCGIILGVFVLLAIALAGVVAVASYYFG